MASPNMLKWREAQGPLLYDNKGRATQARRRLAGEELARKRAEADAARRGTPDPPEAA